MEKISGYLCVESSGHLEEQQPTMLGGGEAIDKIEIDARAGDTIWFRNATPRDEPAHEHGFSHSARRMQMQNPFLSRIMPGTFRHERLQGFTQLFPFVIADRLVVLGGPKTS
jgi:hypothetical protein